MVQNVWVYFEILCGCYLLSQSVRLDNDLLHSRLKKAVYYKQPQYLVSGAINGAHPIFLIVDDFGIEYFRKQHALNLLKILEQNYKITAD